MIQRSNLINRKPQRLFAFGCSFTNHKWPTWADILGLELNIPVHNFGSGGAGNQFIFNKLMSADNHQRFTSDDLIIICWTNLAREDRYVNGQWLTPGNIFTQGEYDRSFVKKYADIVGYAIRDFATIKAAWEFLQSRSCQFHMLKMIDFEFVDQWDTSESKAVLEQQIKEYQFYLDLIKPSYYNVLWQNNIEHKFLSERNEIHPKYKDGHPLLSEHLTYLQNVFNYEFSETTINKVEVVNNMIIDKIRYYTDRNIALWTPEAVFDRLSD